MAIATALAIFILLLVMPQKCGAVFCNTIATIGNNESSHFVRDTTSNYRICALSIDLEARVMHVGGIGDQMLHFFEQRLGGRAPVPHGLSSYVDSCTKWFAVGGKQPRLIACTCSSTDYCNDYAHIKQSLFAFGEMPMVRERRFDSRLHNAVFVDSHKRQVAQVSATCIADAGNFTCIKF